MELNGRVRERQSKGRSAASFLSNEQSGSNRRTLSRNRSFFPHVTEIDFIRLTSAERCDMLKRLGCPSGSPLSYPEKKYLDVLTTNDVQQE